MLLIKFHKGGLVEMTPQGYPGGECRRMTSFYATKMAGKQVKDITTSEACEPERETNTQQREAAEQ